MKRKRILLGALGAAWLLSACGGEKQKAYEDACEKLEQGEYAQALKGFQESVDRDVKVPQSQRGMGIAHMKMGNYDQAVSLFGYALEEEDGKKFRKDVLSYKAAAEYESGKLDEALESCEAIKEIGADASCYFLVGRIGLELDQYDAAKSNFDAAAEQDTSYGMFLDIYQAYTEKDMQADGKEYLTRALNLKPEGGKDYYQRGRIYYLMEDFPRAQEELLKAGEMDYKEARLFLGKVYLEQQDSANARAMYQEYADEGGNAARAYNGLALCDMAEGNYDGALQNIATGLQSADQESAQDLLYNEVVAYENKRDFATARNKITEYLTRYPDDENAQREAGFLQNR